MLDYFSDESESSNKGGYTLYIISAIAVIGLCGPKPYAVYII